jgi:hypothetical protein
MSAAAAEELRRTDDLQTDIIDELQFFLRNDVDSRDLLPTYLLLLSLGDIFLHLVNDDVFFPPFFHRPYSAAGPSPTASSTASAATTTRASHVSKTTATSSY